MTAEREEGDAVSLSSTSPLFVAPTPCNGVELIAGLNAKCYFAHITGAAEGVGEDFEAKKKCSTRPRIFIFFSN